jgi:hypothetical protein
MYEKAEPTMSLRWLPISGMVSVLQQLYIVKKYKMDGTLTEQYNEWVDVPTEGKGLPK